MISRNPISRTPHFSARWWGATPTASPVGHFTLEGKEYQLAVNNGPNNLHSGPDVYRNRIWEASAGADEAGSYAQFSLWSEDGDQGFPGKARIEVRYTLDEDDGVTISYAMVATKTTVANFTNHVYFNLAGQETGKIMDQKVRILADAFTPTDAVSIPTGEIRLVGGHAHGLQGVEGDRAGDRRRL